MWEGSRRGGGGEGLIAGFGGVLVVQIEGRGRGGGGGGERWWRSPRSDELVEGRQCRAGGRGPRVALVVHAPPRTQGRSEDLLLLVVRPPVR